MKIRTTCKGNRTIKLDEAVFFQNDNFKTLSSESMGKLKASIQKHGITFPVYCWKEKNTLVDGHHRVKALRELQKDGFEIDDLPVIDVSAKDEKELAEKLLLLNSKYARITNEGFNDFLESFNLTFEEVDFEIDIPELNFETEEYIDKEKEEIEDDVPEVPEEPKAKLGDIYQLGNHRLMCGDSTSIDDVEKLMDKKLADLIHTDPPYNVSISNSQGMKIQNDDMSNDDFIIFLDSIYKCLFNSIKKGGCAYIYHAESERENFTKYFVNNGFLFKQCLIWVKTTSTLSRQDYNWKHEPILYGWKDGASHYFNKDFTNVTVLDDDDVDLKKLGKNDLINIINNIKQKTPETTIYENKPTVNDVHPTMKPVHLCQKLIENSSEINQIVLDLFGGSGSTLIACEKIKRKCHMMEFDPKYIDVIITRWENYSNKKAIKLN